LLIGLTLWALAGTSARAATDDALGQAVYTNCAGCHGRYGEGGFAPPLARSPHLADTHYVLAKIRAGSSLMPPFGEQLSRREIAAVVAFIRGPGLDGPRRYP
jgi:mono/diheme cytochrome c family protein